MRIAELSRRSEVAVPTIKYYLREGVLPPGERTSPNQALYGDGHVRRLKLVRALTEIGGLSIAAVREVITALDDETFGIHELMGRVQVGITPTPATVAEDSLTQVHTLLDTLGWDPGDDNPGIPALADVISALTTLGHESFIADLIHYARACEAIATLDLAYISRLTPVDHKLEGVVIGTVIGDKAISALRRLAQANKSRSIALQKGGEE